MWQLAAILAVYSREGFPGGSVVKNLPDNAGDVDSIPGWGRASGKDMQLTPVFLPGKSRRQRKLGGYSPWGCKRVKTQLSD